MTAVDQDCLSFSTKTDIVSSLQLDKKIKCRCYISQFTLNDEVLVSVERREHYNVTEKMITIEVDVCVGIHDYGRSKNNEDVPRLRDMDGQDSWVSKITNYDCFVDKDISMWVRDDVMENNKLYLVKHKHERNEEQSVCQPKKSTLRTTGSQFNPPGDNRLNKLSPLANTFLNNISTDHFQSNKDMYPQNKEVMRNELYIHRGEPEVTHVDTMFTSYIDIDLNNNEPNETLEDIPLTTTSHEQSELPLDPFIRPDTEKHRSYYDINLKNDPNYFKNSPLKNNQLIKDDKEYSPKETLEKEKSTKEDTKEIKESDKLLNNTENSSKVKRPLEISSKKYEKKKDVPCAKDSKDDLLNINKGLPKNIIKEDKDYIPKEILEKEKSTKSEFKNTKENDKPLNNNENSSNVKKSPEISREDIPFAEDSEDDLLNIKKGTKTVSKYLQYYLPVDKNREESYSEFGSELGESTGVESNTDSTDDYLENGLVEVKPKIIIASFDDEISDRSKEDACEGAEVHEYPSKFLKPFDKVDFKNNSNNDLESQHQLLNTYDESIDYMDVKCQENMVLQTNERSSSNIISLNLQECRKKNVKVPKSKEIVPKLQKELPFLNEQYQYLPVSLRKLQFEEPEQFVVEPIKHPNNKPLKVKLITSENYTDMVEIERLIKEENSYLENKDHDIDKESSISYSSGSMIVKDVASDENIEFFITHNNIEKLVQDIIDYDDNNYNVNVLDHVEEESDGEYSSSSLKIISPKEHSEQYEDELEPSQSQTEIDATEASSFTGSTNIDNVSLRILAKTPIEKSSENFIKFLEERERQMSIVSKSSLPVSRENSPTSSYTTNKHLQQQFVDDKQNKVEEFINHDHRVLEELQDKSSTLTSISSSTSLQYEDIHKKNHLDISRRSKFEDNITLLEIKKKEYSLEQKEDASSNLSSYSTSSSKKEEIKYVILPSQKAAEDDILKENEGSSTSSEWSFSENQEKRDSLNVESATLKTIPFKDFKLASKKFDQFLIKKQKGNPEENEESSGTEDSSTSSSSSHHQGVQDQIILRHGESIEDIEELLNRQRPSFTPQTSTPLRKQFSLPNMNKRLDPTHANNRSVDHREKLEYQGKKETIKSGKNQNDLISKNYSSGSSTISSSSEEEESDEEENEILIKANMEKCKERDSSSSYENHHKNKSIDHRERFEKGKENKKFKAVPKSNKDVADDVISSSEEEKSDEEENKILMNANMEQCEERDSCSSYENHHKNKSIDHQERFEKGFENKQIKTFIKSKSFENQQPKIPNENKEKKEDTSDTDSTHSSHSHTISTSSEGELKNAKKKLTNNQNMLKIPNIANKNNNEKNISNMSISSATSSCSSHTDSKHRKHASSDHREKLENEKKSGKLKKPNKGYTSKSSSEERSSSSSHTISSSSDEESKYGKKIEIKGTRKLTTPHNSSDSSNTIASSSNEESNFPKLSSIDHREKFENKEIDKKIRFNQQKSSILKDLDNDSNSSYSLSDEELTHSGEISVENQDKFEYAKNNEIKLKPKTSIDSTKNFPNSSGENSHCQRKISIDHREKFKEEDRNSKIKKQISSYDEKMAPENSSEGSNTLSSSSDEEYANIKAVSIDRQEKFESQNKIGKIKKPLTSQKAHDSCSVNSSDEDSVDLDDHSDDVKRKNSSEKLIDSNIIEDKRSPYPSSSSHTTSSSSEENNNLPQKVKENALRNNAKIFNGNGKNSTYSSSETISISSDDEIHKFKNKSKTPEKTKENNENKKTQSLSSTTNSKESNTLINKSADRREDFEDSINPLLLKQEKSELLSDHSLHSKSTTTSKEDEESKKKSKSIDHRENFDNLKMNNKIKKVSKGQFQNNSFSPNTPQENIKKSNSTYIESLSSSSSISFSSSDEDNETDEKRKFQTLPMKKSGNNISLKERSKSLQKSVNIEDTFAKNSNFGGSTIDMIERKYNEYTETWTRQSPIDKKLFKPKSQPNLEKIHNNKDLHDKLPNGNIKYPIKKPFKKGPRPIPSYLSPVNAFLHELSDKEFESNDSLVNDYSSEYNAEEIKPRCGSLPDFIQELSSKKLFKAPFQKPSAPQKPFKLTKPLKPSKFIDLNYGAEDDFVDNSKDVISRTSSVSVITDSSYLEKPILAEKSLKSNLAKLDSMSSSLSSSTVHTSTKSKERNDKANNPVESRSSTSLSSLTSNSESELIEPPVKIEPQRSMNQMYQEKSKIINKSSVYPIKSNYLNRQKIPSSSESSEYSSTSDEETTSSKDILKKK